MSNKKKPRKTTPKKYTKQKFTPTLLWASLGAIAVVIAAVFLSNPGNAVSVESLPLELSVTEAFAMRDAGAFILDVREPVEWNESHIPGATLIPLGELASRVNEVPKDREVVVVCRSGNRSQQGRDILLSSGFEQVTSMAGGMNQWVDAGFETVSGP